MTGSQSAAAVDASPEGTDGERSPDEIKTFLAAIATVLRETVVGFETTVARVTEITVTRTGRADRELVVALQDFDRLQQEFANLSEVIARLSIWSDESASRNGAGNHAIAGISIAELKDRLSHHFKILQAKLPEPDTSEELIF